jgi:hypothetical protein
MQLGEPRLAYEDIKPAVVDTDSVGYNDVTAGSRVTFSSGWRFTGRPEPDQGDEARIAPA